MNFNYKNIPGNASFGSNDLFSGNGQTGRGLTSSEEALLDNTNPLSFKLSSNKGKKSEKLENNLEKKKSSQNTGSFWAGAIGQRLNVIA